MSKKQPPPKSAMVVKATATHSRMAVETVPIDSIQQDPANVRKHGEKNLATIKASLSRFGQQKPIVVDRDGIVRAGNGTLSAAKALGWKEIAIVRTPLAGSEATAFAIADNRTAELAEWDDDALAQTLAALQIEDEALADAAGFDADEIARFAVPDFDSSTIDDQGRLDQKTPVQCPKCGHEFTT